MSRWLKALFLALVVAGAGLGSLPWWLGAALRPVLRARGVTFDRYERVGYAQFQLLKVRYASPALEATGDRLLADTPVVWQWQRWRGIEPVIAVDGWRLRRIPTPGPPVGLAAASPWSSLPGLRALGQRLGPSVVYWLPQVQLRAGELVGFGPIVTIARVDWAEPSLRVENLHVVDQVVTLAIAPAPDGTVTLTAHTVSNEFKLQLAWSGADVKGEARWWDQPLQLAALFPPQGWIPSKASAIAENWQVPAARAKLGAPYATVRGSVRISWHDGALELSADARAEPAPKSRAPPFSATAAAHGDLRMLTLTALQVDAPFATARLTAPVTFSLDQLRSAAPAQLIVDADLAKLPWFAAHGRVHGTVTVAGDTAAVRQEFQLKVDDVGWPDFSVRQAQVRGVLQWPRLELTECQIQLDETSRAAAHGSVDWQTRELAGAVLEAQLGHKALARWLPAGLAWATAAITATADGPLDAPRHQGTVKLTQVEWKPLHPVAVDASWKGEGLKMETLTARVTAGESSLAFTGQLDRDGLLVNTLALVPHGQAPWQLAAPARLAWTPTWSIASVHLTGLAGQLTFSGHGGPDGLVDINATQIDSAWLQDWVTLSGPAWRVLTLQAAGHLAERTAVFSTRLTAEIEMKPKPAQVTLAANGDAHGVQLTEFTVVESGRVLTQATGRVPLTLAMEPTPHLSLDETAPLTLAAATNPDSPLWAALSAWTGVDLTAPEATLNLKGSIREPAGELQVKVARLVVVAKSPDYSLPELEGLAFTLQFGRAAVTLTNFSAQLDGQAVLASGQLPMDDDHWRQGWQNPAAFDWSHATVRLEIPDADLAPLAKRLPKFVAAQGRLRALVILTPGEKLSGELHLAGVASRPLPPFSTLQEINADLALADHTITVQSLTAKLGGEPVTVTGSVTLVPGGVPRFTLALRGRNLPLVRNTGLLLRTDLDLTANSDAAGPTRIGGTATVRDCLMLANLRLSTLLPTGRLGVTLQPPYFSVAAEPFRHWPLAVELRAPGTLRVRTTMYNGTASARFLLGGTLGEPRATGELTVDQGQILFPFATFKVQTGAVRLRESDPFHAVVSLNATSQRRDYQLRLAVTGQLPNPLIALSSVPSLDADEVLLMVMTGRPPNGDALASSGSQRFALLGAYLGRGLFQDLGFSGEDRLEINTGMQVSQLGRETYEFEYKLKDRWSLVGEYDQFDDYNTGVKWRVYSVESKPDEKK